MGKKVRINHVVDVTELGRAGGFAAAKKRTPEERRSIARGALKARWEKYYREHPDKRKKRKAAGR